jgi:hypothetical protein
MIMQTGPGQLVENFAFRYGAGAATVTDGGVGFDALTVQSGDASFAYEPEATVRRLPEHSYAYVVYPAPGDLIGDLLDGREMRAAADELAEQTGVDVDRLLGLLDQPMALVVAETDHGVLAEELDRAFGVGFLAGSSRPDQLQDELDRLLETMGSGFPTTSAGGHELRVLFDDYYGTEVAVFGVDDRGFVAASSGDLAADLIGDGGDVTGNAVLMELAGHLDVDPESVAVFVDTQALVRLFAEDPGTVRALAPLGAFGAAFEFDGPRMQTSAFWLIDPTS